MIVVVYGELAKAPLLTVPEITPVLELIDRPLGKAAARIAQRAAGVIHRSDSQRDAIADDIRLVARIGDDNRAADRPVEADAVGIGAVADRDRGLPEAAVAQRAGDYAGAGIDRQTYRQVCGGIRQRAADADARIASDTEAPALLVWSSGGVIVTGVLTFQVKEVSAAVRAVIGGNGDVIGTVGRVAGCHGTADGPARGADHQTRRQALRGVVERAAADAVAGANRQRTPTSPRWWSGRRAWRSSPDR